MNYDFAASGKIEGESIRIQVDDENFDDDIVIDRKEVYLQCVSNDLTPEEAIKKIIEMKIKEKQKEIILTNHQYSVVGIFMLKNRRKDENEGCGGIDHGEINT